MSETVAPSAEELLTQLVTGPSIREVAAAALSPALNALYPPNRQLSARIRAFIDWLEELFGGELP